MVLLHFLPIVILALICWSPVQAGCRVLAGVSSIRNRPKLVRHLLEGPTIALTAFLFGLFSYHAVMIECSKHQIRAYVYGTADYRTDPEFKPHLIIRSFCGNANMGMVYELYGGTALEGLDDPDPNVRAKSLRMSLRVSGFAWNGMDDTMKAVVRKALSDPSPRVQDVAREFELTPDVLDRE